MPICQAAIKMVWLLFTELDFPPIFYLKDFFFQNKKNKKRGGRDYESKNLFLCDQMRDKTIFVISCFLEWKKIEK